MDRDREQLRLLAVFHFVVAGMAALAALLPVFHLVLGIAMVTGRVSPEADTEGLRWIGWFFVIAAAIVIVSGFAFAACLAVAGRYLLVPKHRTYCLVLAALACFFAPFGTVLGVFTLVVLLRPSMPARFGEAPP